MKRKLIVKQHGSKDCGASTLLSIIRYYGGNISLEKLIDLTMTTKDGTNFLKMQTALKKMNIESVGYKVENIKTLKKWTPFIAQIINHNWTHFVVVYEIRKNDILVMDPAVGKRIITNTEWEKLWTKNILVFKPYQKIPYYKNNKHILNIIYNILLSNKKTIFQITMLSIICTIFSCIYSFNMKILIDKVINTNVKNLITVTLIFILVVLIKTISNLIRNHLLIFLNQKLDIKLVLNTFKHIISLPYNYYKTKTTGEVISRINDLSHIKNMISKLTLTVFLDIMLFITGGILLFLINSSLFMVAVCIIIIYIIVLIIFRPLKKDKIIECQENNGIVNSYMIESIGGVETVKGLNIEKNIINKFEYYYSKSLNNVLSYDIISNYEMFIKETIELLGIILINYLGMKLVFDNTITIGSLLTFNSLLVYFINPIKNVIDLDNDYLYAMNSLKRANSIYDIDTIDLEKRNIYKINGQIEFKNVNFSYNTIDNILKNINFKINNNERVLLLGPSGSGKSTILKLIYKYYNIERNKIFINNIDINDYEIADIRNNIDLISQNEILWTDSIKNNIILDRKIEYEQFLKISSATFVNKIVEKKLLGYDSLLEENGHNLSGGERQRIVLARTMLSSKPIVLIDEGLSEIDINLERKILKNLFNNFKNKTFIIISHRKNNMDLYDKVLDINSGIIKLNERKNNGYT